MSSCDDAFKKLQALQAQKDEIDARVAKLAAQVELEKTVGQDPYADITRRMATPELDDLVNRGLEGNARVDIGDGQPTNFNILMRQHELQTVEDYARLNSALMGTNRLNDPAYSKEIGAVYGREKVMKIVEESYAEFLPPGAAVRILMADAAPFTGLVERMTRLRYIYDTARNNLSDSIDTMAAHQASTALPVTPELKKQFANDYKLALLSERHFDFAKRKTGQTLRSLQDDIDDATIDALGEVFRNDSYWKLDKADVEEVIGFKGGDISRDSLAGKVVDALDITDKAKSAEQLKTISKIMKMDGVDPKSRMGQKNWTNLLRKRGNALIKDSQLFNLRTQLLANPLPNFQMALLGPVRTALENGQRLTPFGTKFSRDATLEGFQVAFKGFKEAIDTTRAGFKELVSDAAMEGKAAYGGYKDSNRKPFTSNEDLIAQLHQQLDEPLPPGGFLTPDGLLAANHKLQAAFRLKMYEEFKNPFLLSPGFRGMAAADNVVGHFNYMFKRKNELEMMARAGVDDIDLSTEAKRAEWVAEEFDKGFQSIEPSEQELKNYRRKFSLKNDVTDEEIAAEIIGHRTADTYRIPTANPDEVGRQADVYSREMRSQGEFSDYGGLGQTSTGQAINNAVQTARKDFRVDFVLPYWQSAISGELLAMDQMFIGPMLQSLPGPKTPAQVARVKANWAISGGFLGLWAGLHAMDPDLIQGNGPVDPNDRQEWLIQLRAKGLTPNSIAGVQMPTGFLDPLFFWTDVHQAVTYGTLSESDQHVALRTAAIAFTGRLMRQTSFGQIKTILDLLLDPTKTKAQKVAQSLGYVVGGTIPGIGVGRSIDRFSGNEQQFFYGSNGPSPKQNDKGFDDGIFGSTERFMQSFLLGASPGLSRVTGSSAYRETDWLGSKIALPFGQRMITAFQHRFFPQLHPNDKVYQVLDDHNILEPPTPLFNQTLEGVPMSDQLQKLYNDTYSTVKGELSPTARLKLSGIEPAVKLNFKVQTDLKDDPLKGITITQSKNVASIPLAPFLEKHVKGKTAIEAFRSVINDPRFQEIERNTALSGVGPNQLASERKTKPGTQILKAVKTYYELLARDQLNSSDDPLAQAWRKQRNAMNHQNFAQATEEFTGLAKNLYGSQEQQQPNPMQTLQALPGR